MYHPIPNVYVIGLGHKARNGKDTTAAVFQDYFRSNARRYSFADHLRSICRVDFGMTDKDARLLQVVGTEVYRNGQDFELPDGKVLKSRLGRPDPHVWTRATYWTIKEQSPLVAIISDVRFPNEADMVKQMGGMLIKVTRLTQSGRPYVDPSRDPKHPSETALDGYKGWDAHIIASSVSDLEYQAVQIAEQLALQIGFHEV